MLKSSLRKFYYRHHDFVNHYAMSVTDDHPFVPFVVVKYRYVMSVTDDHPFVPFVVVKYRYVIVRILFLDF